MKLTGPRVFNAESFQNMDLVSLILRGLFKFLKIYSRIDFTRILEYYIFKHLFMTKITIKSWNPKNYMVIFLLLVMRKGGNMFALE